MNVLLRPATAPAVAKAVLFFPRFAGPQFPVWLPLEVMTLGAALREAGYAVRIIDDRVEDDAESVLLTEAADALFVGFSARPGDQVFRSMEMMRLCRAAHPDSKIVFGGWFPTSFPDAAMQIDDVDIVVRGAADRSIVDLADRLRDGASLVGVDGVLARENGNLLKNPRRALENIEETPRIPFDLFPVDRYITADGAVNLYTSRGCPGMCRFCGVPTAFPGAWTGLPASRVVDDIEYMYREHGATIFKTLDTDFFPDHDRAKEICRAIIERKLDIQWIADVRVRDIVAFDDEMWDLLKRSGCVELETGGESGSAERLEDMIKECEVEDVYEAARRVVGHGMTARFNFILGLPRERSRDLLKTLRLMRRIQSLGDRIKMQFYRFTPSPTTRFGAEAWSMKTRGHDGQIPRSVEQINAIPINHDEQSMFWLSEPHERKIKRLYYLYLPLVYYLRGPIANGNLKGVRAWAARLVRALAALRTSTGWTALPFERLLARWIGMRLPRTREFEWKQDDLWWARP